MNFPFQLFDSSARTAKLFKPFTTAKLNYILILVSSSHQYLRITVEPYGGRGAEEKEK